MSINGKVTLGLIAGLLCGIFTTTLFFQITRPVPTFEQHTGHLALSPTPDTPAADSGNPHTENNQNPEALQDEKQLPPKPNKTEAPTQQKPEVKSPLLIPVYEIKASELRDTFTHPRDGGRRHHAIDIMAPEDTPVLAVEDGTIVRMLDSDDGGLAIYHLNTGRTRVYYYAHLEDYASNLYQGKKVKRGDIIGYVGSTGNADSDYPHLHFAVSEIGPGKRWWKGKAINPYPLLTQSQDKK